MATSSQYAPGEQPVLDRYTVGHAAVGVVYGLTSMPWWAALGLAVAWEVVENPLKDAYPQLFPDAKHDRYENAAVDVVAVMAGFWAIRRAKRSHAAPSKRRR